MVRHLFFFSSRRRHTRCLSDWSSDVCSSDLFLITPDAHGRRLICNLPAFRCRLGPNERSCPHGGYLWIGLFWPSCSGRLQYSCQSQPLPTCLPSRQRPFGAPSQTLPAL